MTPLEFDQASDALILWLQSQEISPADSVPLMLGVSAALVKGLAIAGDRNEAQGAKAALALLKEALK